MTLLLNGLSEDQQRELLGVGMFLDGDAEQLAETCLAAQETRHLEVEQAPQLAEVVLPRCAREADALARVQRGCALGGLRAGVLDVLCLVQHHQVPALFFPQYAVALQQ